MTAARHAWRLIKGGFIPLGAYTVAHGELASASGGHWYALAAIVLGALVFSAKNVWQSAQADFSDRWKATGFTVLLEGVMVCSSTPWLRLGALAILVGVNAITTMQVGAARDAAARARPRRRPRPRKRVDHS